MRFIEARETLPPLGMEGETGHSRELGTGVSIVLIDRRPLTRQCISRWLQEGSPDLRVVSVGSPADLLDASVEILDIRSLKPLDEDALLAAAAKTGRVVIVQEAPRVAGYGAELAAILAEKAMLDLRGPVLRVTGYDVPYPYWQIEDAYMPSVERVVDAVQKLLEY